MWEVELPDGQLQVLQLGYLVGRGRDGGLAGLVANVGFVSLGFVVPGDSELVHEVCALGALNFLEGEPALSLGSFEPLALGLAVCALCVDAAEAAADLEVDPLLRTLVVAGIEARSHARLRCAPAGQLCLEGRVCRGAFRRVGVDAL